MAIEVAAREQLFNRNEGGHCVILSHLGRFAPEPTTQACTLVINDPNAPPPPPTLTISTACPLNSGVVGSSFSQSLGTTGGTGAVTLSISSGGLPNGLTLTGNTISGTPTGAGTASFTIQAVDSGSPAQTATKSCSMTVNAAPTAPVITTACPLTQGVVGQPYHLNLGATGSSPITWSITTGTLPVGMALFSSGLLTGVPHHPGTYNFTLRATNSVTSVTQAYSLVILLHAPPPPPRARRSRLVRRRRLLSGLPTARRSARLAPRQLRCRSSPARCRWACCSPATPLAVRLRAPLGRRTSRCLQPTAATRSKPARARARSR
ncbi:MAG: hypothetical protein FJW38_10095 [Acidobacteria bacterium]|nr:hypothetical protein [Acidobacteriota bacterium]